MEKDFEKSKSFTRRSFLLGAAKVGILAGLTFRLGFLQITEAKKYKMLSDKNRIDLQLLSPSRGKIFDRAGTVMAQNTQDFRVLMTPERTKNMEETLKKLSEIIPLEEHEIKRAISTAAKVPKYSAVTVREGLNWDQVSAIEVNLPHLPGLSTEAGESRDYPMLESTAHLIGYVGLVNEAEQQREEAKELTLPGFRIGKTGIEKELDPYLRGRAGASKIEVNALGRQVRELEKAPSVAGHDIFLTVDAGMQEFTQKILSKRKSASAVIMNVHTGEIYAMASHPSFNPNLFNGRLSAEKWEELLSDPAYPLTNKAISGQYPPGSTFKMITGLAALEAGVINERSSFFCPGHMDVGDHRFHCWKRGGHGQMNLIQALAESCDTFFYQIARETGIERIATVARRFGLDQKFDLEIAGLKSGLVPDKQWKMATHGKSWSPGETIIATIGQGYLQATPLQLTVMIARMVNGGRKVEPHLVHAIGDVFRRLEREEYDRVAVSTKYLSLLQRGMDRVVNHPTGTASKYKIDIPGWEMAGKTGTSQVRRIRREERLEGIEQENLPWKERHHALFTGYAPAHKPLYACSVVVEHGGSGSSAAAPLVQELLTECQRRKLGEFTFDFPSNINTDTKAG